MNNYHWNTSRLWRRHCLTAGITLSLLAGIPYTPWAAPKAEAGLFDIISDVIATASNASAARLSLLDAGNNPAVQNQMYIKRGVNQKGINRAPDAKAIQITNDVMKQLIEHGDFVLRNNSLPYRWKVVANNEFNASCDAADFIVVYDGLVQDVGYNCDELAAVLGHEMTHGYHQHIANSVQKTAWANLLKATALTSLSTTNFGTATQLPEAWFNFLIVKNISVKDENDADRDGFYNMVSAGFNPGGAAACMARMSYYTEHRDSVTDFYHPSDHPDTRNRLIKMARLMTDYSIGHVTVVNSNDVYFDNKLLLTAEPYGKQDAEEMAYLIAGGIAKGLHDNTSSTAWNFHKTAKGSIDFLDNSTVYSPLKNALKKSSGLDEKFQSLIEAAYLRDASSGARDKFLAAEQKRKQNNEALRQKMAASQNDTYMKSANGDAYMQLGLTDLADKEYHRASKLNPSNLGAQGGIAMVLAKHGRFAEAIKLSNDTISKSPDSGYLYVTRAHIYHLMGKNTEALADCGRAVSAKHKATYAYKMAGDIFNEIGAKENALTEYSSYLKANPKATDIPEEYVSRLK